MTLRPHPLGLNCVTCARISKGVSSCCPDVAYSTADKLLDLLFIIKKIFLSFFCSLFVFCFQAQNVTTLRRRVIKPTIVTFHQRLNNRLNNVYLQPTNYKPKNVISVCVCIYISRMLVYLEVEGRRGAKVHLC